MKDMKELLHSAHLTKTQRIIAEYVLDLPGGTEQRKTSSP